MDITKHINVDRTLQELGVDIFKLKPNSGKLVYKICEICKKESLKRYQSIAAFHQTKCISCANVLNGRNNRGKFNLASANSINISRLIPQSFYYFAAYAEAKRKGLSDPLVFSVPSGNFGNLSAGLMAYQMGLLQCLRHLQLVALQMVKHLLQG